MRHLAPQRQKQNTNTGPQHQKWATFTYIGKETRKITKLFKDRKTKIAFRTRNNIQNIVRQHPQKDEYSDRGIYQMKCLGCPFKYIGQTGSTFHTRYREHIHALRNNNSNSGYSNHILNMGHKYDTIADTMDIIKTHRKRKHLNTLEKYCIYKISRDNLQMNDTNTDTNNPIFKALHEMNTR
jgi:hypothetical protein